MSFNDIRISKFFRIFYGRPRIREGLTEPAGVAAKVGALRAGRFSAPGVRKDPALEIPGQEPGGRLPPLSLPPFSCHNIIRNQKIFRGILFLDWEGP
jgi:hypothetical protein